MLVWETELDPKELYKSINAGVDIVKYSDDMVPAFARHVPGLIHNQRYLLALAVRGLNLDFKRKQLLISRLTNNISITGIINAPVSLREAITKCNVDILLKALKNDE